MNMRGGMSKYEYLFQCIRRDIQSGALPPDFRLPSKRSLAEHLMVSVTTVENAYSMLVSEGYLYTKQSSGFLSAAGLCLRLRLTSQKRRRRRHTVSISRPTGAA